MSNIQKLTKAEEEIMHLYWEHGSSTISALIKQMKGSKPPHSTISSIARILEGKGFLDHNTYGRTHEYFAVVKKKEYSKFSLKALIMEYFEGSPNELVSFLVEQEDLSLSDLEDIRNEVKK